MTLAIVVSTKAEGDIRALDRTTAKRVLDTLDLFVESGAGDVKKLKGLDEYRL